MAEASTTSPDSASDSKKGSSKKGGLLTLIKKNKTAAAVIGVGGLYFLYKMNSEKSGESASGEPEGEVTAVAGEGGAAAGTAELAAFEAGRAERLAEGSHREVEELEEEREEERSKRKEKERQGEEEENPGSGESPGEGNVPGTGGGTGGGEVEPPAVAPGAGISIHGRNFPGATGSHIAKTGKTDGGKVYVEYAIQFPGKVEHWQYFTASGNWRQVAGSDTGGGANKPGPGNNPKPTQPPSTGGHPKPTPKARPKEGVGKGRPVSQPKPKPAPQPAPPRAPDCAPGTVGNILHARAEVNRLQGEIDQLTANINAYPKANARPGWINNRAGKQATRDQFQAAIANGRAQPGCGNV